MNWITILCQIILTLFIGVETCYSQDNLVELKRLDSIAFSALENNSPEKSVHANELLKASIEQNEPLYKINALTILGIINKEKGYFVTALNHNLEALNTAEFANDEPRVSACYNNIGQIYQLQENFVKAKFYYQKSLAIENSLNNQLQKSIRLYNIGEVYNELDSLDLALTYFNNSLLIEKQAKNIDGEIYALLGISNVYIKIKRFTDAEITLNEVKSLLSPEYLEVTILYHILNGKLNNSREDRQAALNHFKTAEKLSTDHEFRIHLPEIYQLIIEILKADLSWKECTKYYTKHTALAQKLNTLKVKNQLEDMTFQNELNKKTLEIEFVQEERDLAKKNTELYKGISSYTTKIIWFLVLSIILIIGTIIIGLNYFNKK